MATSDSRSPWRARGRSFGGRYLIAFAVSFVLTTGGIFGVNFAIDAKVARIPRVKNLHLASSPGQAGNFLIIGSDSRAFVTTPLEAQEFGSEVGQGGQRSDTMMILHVDPAQRTSLLMSIPRDTIVNIPGEGRNLINAAYNVGPQKVIDTVESNFDVKINHYVEVDFVAFVGIVNAVGRVPVYFPQPTRDLYTGLSVTAAGCVPLDGVEALQYVRSRHTEVYDAQRRQWVDATGGSDLARIQRQQNFIRRMAEVASKKAAGNPFVANDVADAIVPKLHVDTQLTRGDILRLVDTFRKVNPSDTSALQMETLPTMPAPDNPNHLVPKQPDADQMLATLRTFGPPPKTSPAPTVLPSQVRVRVLNGTGQAGAAVSALDELGTRSFQPAGTGNAASTTATEVHYRPGQEAAARLVQSYLGGVGTLVPDSSIVDADVVIVLGHDYRGVTAPGAATTTSSSTTTTPVGGLGVTPSQGPAC